MEVFYITYRICLNLTHQSRAVSSWLWGFSSCSVRQDCRLYVFFLAHSYICMIKWNNYNLIHVLSNQKILFQSGFHYFTNNFFINLKAFIWQLKYLHVCSLKIMHAKPSLFSFFFTVHIYIYIIYHVICSKLIPCSCTHSNTKQMPYQDKWWVCIT